MALFRVLLLACMPVLCVSCMSTRMYVRTHDKTYEDDVLIAEEYRESLDGEEQKSVRTTYHDLSNAGYIVTDSEEHDMEWESGSQHDSTHTIHSFVAQRTLSSGTAYSELSFSLVETKVIDVVRETEEGESQKTYYSTEVIGTRNCKVDGHGKVVAAGTAPAFSGDAFADDDEELFTEVLALSLPAILNPDAGEIDESSGKTFRTEESIEEITVQSKPNQAYIAYSIIGKPFVIIGSSLWNLIKCVGYSFYNFTGGYSLVAGTMPQGMSPWKMPSFKTAKKKFADAKAANAVQHYPEYHLPFTDNEITVKRIEQETAAAFITDDNAEIRRETLDKYDNTLSVTRSASSDATYTAGVVGVIGTGITIPVAATSWVAGAAIGVYGQTQTSRSKRR